MPYRRMKMPGMRVEIRGFAKLKIDDRSIRGLPGDVMRLIQIVTIVVSSQLRPNQVEHSRGDLLSVDPLLAQNGSVHGERLKSVDNRLVVGHRRLPPARQLLQIFERDSGGRIRFLDRVTAH